MGVAFEPFTVQHCGLITLSVLLVVFITFLLHMIGCIILKNLCILRNKNLH